MSQYNLATDATTPAAREESNHLDKDKLGSDRLMQNILAQKAGDERAGEVFAVIAGAYDMGLGDAHPTSSKIGEALSRRHVGARVDVAAASAILDGRHYGREARDASELRSRSGA